MVAVVSLCIAVLSACAAAFSAFYAHRANQTADRANELAEEAIEQARRTHDDNLALNAPILTVTSYVLEADGVHVTLHNSGETPAREIMVSLANSAAQAATRTIFSPRPLEVIERQGDGSFFMAVHPLDFYDAIGLGEHLSASWSDGRGAQHKEVFATPVNMEAVHDVIWAETEHRREQGRL